MKLKKIENSINEHFKKLEENLMNVQERLKSSVKQVKTNYQDQNGVKNVEKLKKKM